MQDRNRILRAVLFATLVSFWGMITVSVQGCTIIGLTVGANADKQAGTGGPGMIFRVKAGTPMTLDLLDGTTTAGRFAGWSRDSANIAAADSLPLRGVSVMLEVGREKRSIPAEKIEQIHVNRSAGTLTGLIVGVGLDILVIRSMDDMFKVQPTGCEASNTPRLFGENGYRRGNPDRDWVVPGSEPGPAGATP